MKCLECEQKATWARFTQFHGIHPYCYEHAKQESDFNENSSYLFWGTLELTDHLDWTSC